MKTLTSKLSLALAALAVALSAPASLFADIIDEAEFRNKMEIKFPNSGIPANAPLANFPAPVVLGEDLQAGFSYGMFESDSGADLRFADEHGNILAHEIDTWDTNGHSLVWVRVPSLNEETSVIAYWGSETVPPPPPASDTWSENYYAVWHFGEDDIPLADSTASAYDLTRKSSAALTFGETGKLGRNVDTIAGERWLATGASIANPRFTEYTLEAYVLDRSNNSSGTIGALISKRAQGTSDATAFSWFKQDGGLRLDSAWPSVNASGTVRRYNLPNLPQSVWTHNAVTFVSSPGIQIKSYNDGVNTITKTASDSNMNDTKWGACAIHIGILNEGDGRGWNGKFDEVRISSVARSPEWIAASAASMNAPYEFADYVGIETITQTALKVVTLEAELTYMNAALSARVSSNDPMLPATVTLYWGENDGGTEAAAWAHTNVIANIFAGENTTNILTMGVTPDFYFATDYHFRHYAANAVDESWSMRGGTFHTRGEAVFGVPEATANLRDATFSVTLENEGAAAPDITFWMGFAADALEPVASFPAAIADDYLFTTNNIQLGSEVFYAFSAVNQMPDAQGKICTVWTPTNSIILSGTSTWTAGGQSDDWFDPDNWDRGVPGPHATALFINLSRSLTVNASEDINVGAVNIRTARAYPFTFDLEGATLNAEDIRVGESAFTADVTLTNGVINAGTFYVGVFVADSTMTVAAGSRLNAANLTVGHVASNNSLIVEPNATLNAGYTIVTQRTGDGQNTDNNDLIVRGLFLADGIQIGPNAGWGGTGFLTVDGGTVTNTANTQIGFMSGSLCEITLRNNARFVQAGGAIRIGARVSRTSLYVLDDSVCEVIGNVELQPYADSANPGNWIVVSNAVLTATGNLTVGHNTSGHSNVIAVYEDPGRTASVTIAGSVSLGSYSRNNLLSMNGGTLDFAVLNASANSQSTANRIEIYRANSRITGATANFRYAANLKFTLPREGFADVPLTLTGAAAINPDTTVDVDATSGHIGITTLFTAASGIDALEGRVNAVSKPGYGCAIIIQPDSLSIRTWIDGTLIFIK